MSNPRVVYVAPDGCKLEFGRGNFDEWCVWECGSDGSRYAPRDIDYFASLIQYAETYTAERVYSDFVSIYNVAGTDVSELEVAHVKALADFYQGHIEAVTKVFLILLMGMVAENRKLNTRLGKRIKRLGVYDLLFVSRSVVHAANFMRGKSWRELDGLCREYGF